MKKKRSDNTYFRTHKLLMTAFAVFIILFSAVITDCCFEYAGVPRTIQTRIFSVIRKFGLHVKAEDIHIGILKGISLRNAEIYDSVSGTTLKASRMMFNLYPTNIFSGIFLPIETEIEGGTLIVPLFPELGEEADRDVLRISDLNARVVGVKGLLNVRYADCIINGIRFRTNGSIDNLLHFSLAQSLDLSRNYIFHEEETLPILQKANPITKFVHSIPLDLRKKFLQVLERIEQKKFKEPPLCRVSFFADLKVFTNCKANIQLQTSRFKYGKLEIGSMKQSIHLQNGQFTMKEMSFDLGNGACISLSGTVDGKNSTASGKVTGKGRPEDVLLFVDEQTRSEIRKKISFGKTLVPFSGQLKKLSLVTGNAEGWLTYHIPYMVVDGVRMRNVSVELFIEGSNVTGKLKKTDLDDGGHLQGRFRIMGKEFSCEIEGAASPKTLPRILDRKSSAYIRKNISFTKPEQKFSFSGKLASKEWTKSKFNGNFNIAITDLEFNSIKMDRITANIGFTENQMWLKNGKITLANGSKLQGSIRVLPENKIMIASVVGSGNPAKLIRSMKGENIEFLKEITKEIKWPDSDEFIECTAEIHAGFGQRPYLYMSGNLIMKDFAFNKIPFNYGAARFIISSNGIVLLPDVILENADGRLAMKAAYKPGPPKNGRPISPGQFFFSTQSSLKGEDLIRLIYPTWKSKYIHFPSPLLVKASGEINYADLPKTHYTSEVYSGSCKWFTMPVNNLKLKLSYKNQTLSFNNAVSEFCKGRGITNYYYDFQTEKGNFSFELENADAAEFIRISGFGKILNSKNFSGRISSRIKADFAFDKKDDILLYGNGNMTMTGENILNVPVFSKLLSVTGSLWGIRKFGEITEISSIFDLKDDTLYAKMKTDGGFIALNAGGTYNWNIGHYEFVVRPALLKNILPFEAVPRLLFPVTWVFNRTLTGNAYNFQWK